jgi:hypothetical protein
LGIKKGEEISSQLGLEMDIVPYFCLNTEAVSKMHMWSQLQKWIMPKRYSYIADIFVRTEHTDLVKRTITENSISGLLLLMFWNTELNRRNISSP